MSNLLNALRPESKVSAITCIIIGVLFIIWPGSSLVLLLRILALILIVEGIVCIVRLIRTKDAYQRNVYIAPAVICLFVGLLLLAAPRFVAGIFPVIFGLFLLLHGLRGLVTTRHGSASMLVGVLGSVIMLLLGILLIMHPFGALKVLMVFVGIALVYDGIITLRLTDTLQGKARQYREDHDPDIIDVDYKEEKR